MRQNFSGRRWFRRALAAGAVVVSAFVASAEDAPLGFGFTGPEIYPIDSQIGNLRAADFDGDGWMDLAVVNNNRSKINLLFNQTAVTNVVGGGKPGSKREINELPPDARFRIDSIASEKRIAGLVVEDLSGDGRPDIAYFGEPKELVVHFNDGTNGWSTPKRWPLEDGQLTPNGLAAGDLNHDGLKDLVLLGEHHLHILTQQADHSLGEPVRLPFSGSVKSVQVLDINGDGRDDLLLVNWESPSPFRFRLQNEAGQLGPETYFSFLPVRAYWADVLESGGNTKVVTIAQNSGRAQISHFTRKSAEASSGALEEGQLQVMPLSKTGKARRGVVWADVNGDTLADLLVSEPDSGELTLFLQTSDGTLTSARRFPTLTGVSDMTCADWDGDGRLEIFLLSSEERQVGVTRLDENGRVPFPDLLPLGGRPLAVAAGPLRPGERPGLAVLLDQEGERHLAVIRADGTRDTQKLAASFKANPTSLTLHDVDQDGLADLVVLIPYEKIKVLRQVAGKGFEELDIAPPGGGAEQPWIGSADVDGDGTPELLLAQRNFVRAVVLKLESFRRDADEKAAWTFSVKEQINGASGSSRLVGAAAAGRRLFLLDSERKALTVCDRDDSGVWQVSRNIPLPFSEFNAIEAVALGGITKNAVAFSGLNSVAWLPLQGDVWELTELDGYETPVKDGRLNDVISGDLNNDGRKDLVFMETARNHIDLVLYEPPGRLVPGNRWQVFEEKTFRARRGDMPEPREALVADITGDGKSDLVVLVHDRILVYPQE